MNHGKMNQLNRRTFLKASGSALGAAAGARILGPMGVAHAAEKSVVVTVYFPGGYNAIFSSADSFVSNGAFGVTNTNIMPVGGGIFVDKDTMGTLPKFALDHMSTVGVYHGITSHFSVENAILIGGQENYLVNLANAIGGNAALKAIYLGDATSRGFPLAFPPAVNGTSLQRITDISAAIQAIGGAGPDPAAPNVEISQAAFEAMGQMSGRQLADSPKSIISYKEGLDTGLETLKKPVKPFSVAELRTAYGIPATSNVIGNSFPLKFATAELMIRSGANVINILDSRDTDVVPWDFHQTTGGRSRNGEFSRRRMTQRVIGPMRTFLDRVLNLEGYNVVVAVLGDFGRSLGGDHIPSLSVSVMGKYVKQGTTGKVAANALLDRGTTPPIKELWSYLAAAAKVPNNPFGANKHGSLLL
ncbi:MAG: hypothetical protein KBF88_01880 [Polyangiaceae bacterium]|nr:hypothetical protein [Polyangiaceae bacterium]